MTLPPKRKHRKPKFILTSELMRLSYDLASASEPFAMWDLPHSSSIIFVVNQSRTTSGDYYWCKKRKKHVIRCSKRCIGTLHTLNEIMMHEMIHLYQREIKSDGGPYGPVMHNAQFLKLSDAVCSVHLFDRPRFAEIE